MSTRARFKIETISGPADLQVGEDDIGRTLSELQSNGSWDGLHIYPAAEPSEGGHWQFPRISASWEAEAPGYIVQCCERVGVSDFILATSASLSPPEVYLEHGGSAMQELWPTQLFVPHDLALRALQHLLHTGLQDPELIWVELSAFQRTKVRRRAKRA